VALKETTFTDTELLSQDSDWASAGAIIIAIAAAKFLLQMVAAHHYGYFRDELYFVDISRHLDWGYLDFPPLIAFVTWLSRAVLGESLPALRFFPALAGAIKVLLAGLIARELGGGRFAQALAALAVVVAPAYLGADHLLTMNAFEQVLLTGCAYALIRAIRDDDPRAWVLFGVLAGLGLENKYSMFFFGFGVLVGLLLTRERRLLLNRRLWLGALAAFVIFLPNLLWEIHRGFPSLQWLRYHRVAGPTVPLTPVEFMAEQILDLNPLACPIWMAGLWYYLGAPEGKPYRVLGWTYLVALTCLLVLRGRVYYLFPAYPMLFGSGAVVIEKILDKFRWAWAKPAYLTALVLGGAFLAPFALPVLPVQTYIRYSETLDLDPPDIETRKLGKLPQLYADMFGWEEMTAAVARAYSSLPPERRSETAIFANDYGEGGALDFFGPKYGLPRVICPHLTYFDWGPRDYTGASIILVGHNSDLESECMTSREVGTVRNDYSMPYENVPIVLCTGLKRPLKEVWPALRDWK
jgi:dolichyl-phosphate-mannose-protein mannosyltransferase